MWTYFDIFEQVLKPNNFNISKEKISVYGRETYARMFHGQLVVWLSSGIFWVLSDNQMFLMPSICQQFCINLILLATDCTNMSYCHWKGVPQDLYQWVIYIFCNLGLMGGFPSISKFLYSACGLSCFLELF